MVRYKKHKRIKVITLPAHSSVGLMFTELLKELLGRFVKVFVFISANSNYGFMMKFSGFLIRS